MEKIWHRYKAVWSIPGYLPSFFLSLLAFAAALAANFYAIAFATERASNPVTDLILSNTPVFEIDGLFIYGTAVFVAFAIGIVMLHPKRIPFTLFGLALFMIIRATFTSLTHTGPFEAQYVSDFGETLTKAFFGADHFFSGHTGMPFLAALAFWADKPIRYIFLAGSLFFAAVVLLGHVHYTIDVLAAFFITYGIFHLALYLFPKEWAFFHSEH